MSTAQRYRFVSPCICECCGTTIGATRPKHQTLLAPTEDVEGNEEIRIEEEEGDDSATGIHRSFPSSGDPSQRQVEEHRRTHWPYRLWCKWCVLGRGRGAPHTSTGKSDIPVVGIDYFFITKGGSIQTKLEVEAADDMEEKRKTGEVVK